MEPLRVALLAAAARSVRAYSPPPPPDHAFCDHMWGLQPLHGTAYCSTRTSGSDCQAHYFVYPDNSYRPCQWDITGGYCHFASSEPIQCWRPTPPPPPPSPPLLSCGHLESRTLVPSCFSTNAWRDDCNTKYYEKLENGALHPCVYGQLHPVTHPEEMGCVRDEFHAVMCSPPPSPPAGPPPQAAAGAGSRSPRS